MNAKVLLPLVAVALALGGWWALSGDAPTAPPEGPTTAVAADDPEPADDAGPTTPVTLDPVTGPDGPAVPERTAVAAEERPPWTTGAEARLVEGRVVLPPGTPGDEELRLRLRTTSEVAGYEEGYVQLLEGATFSLVVPPAEVAFELSLEGRYLYLTEALRFDGEVADPLLVEPRLGAWLGGRVRPAAGAAGLDLAEGEVRVGLDFEAGISQAAAMGAQDLGRRLELDGAGRFDAFGMPALRGFGLEVDVPGAPLALLGGLSLEPGEHRVLDVPLERGATLRGLVLDDAGSPVAGAEVRAVAGEDIDIRAQRRAREGTSDAEGRFELAGLPAGEQRLTATAPGFKPAKAGPLPLADGQVHDGLELVLDAGAAVAGRVLLPDGSPAAEAEVELSFDPAALNGLNAASAAEGASGTAVCDAEGAFRITGLGGGPFLVRAELFREEGPWLFDQTTSVQPGTTDLELRLREVPALTGSVLDQDGEPVTDYRLDLRAGNLGGLIAGERTERRVTDPEGRFSIDRVADGAWNLYVEAEGFGYAGPVSADRPGPGSEPLTITLERGVTLAGRVVDPGGRPVRDARVVWQADSRDLVLNIIKAGPSVDARSDEAGAFELAGLPAGALTVETSSDHWAPGEALTLDAAPGERIEDLELVLREGGTITGIFLDDEGEPQKSALVQIQEPGGANQQVTQTDGEGTFRVGRLVPGTWQVVGIGPAAEGEETTDQLDMLDRLEMELVEVADGETVEVVLGAPPEDPVRLLGQVEPADALAGGMAILVPEGEDLLSAMKMTRIEDDGRFELDLEGPGTYVITLQSTPEGGIGQDNVEYLEEVPPGPEHRVTLTLPEGAIAGRVTGSDGRPLVGERVSLYADGSTSTGTISGGKYAETTTDDEGRYRVERLEPGTYTVGAGGRPLTALFGEEDGHGRAIVTGIAVADGAEVGGVDFELDLAGSVSGRITNSAGKPVEGASIFVRAEDGTLLERISLQTSGPGGTYDYRGLAPGDYTISARTREEASGEELPVRVRPGAATEVDLVLDPATMVEVIVTDDEGTPMMAAIEILDGDGHDVAGQFGMADLTGMLSEGFSTTTRRFGPLPPGKYRVRATSGDLSASKLMNLKGQDTRTVRIRLK